MLTTSTLRGLDAEAARAAFDDRAALVDVRPVDEYLGGHVLTSLCLSYERGPGFAGRARDCLPLDLPLILVDDEMGDLVHAAASLRGKGFEVLGRVARDAVRDWPAGSTDVVTGSDAPDGFLLDVGDPGAKVPDEAPARVPIDRLWAVAEEIREEPRVVVVAGAGVRAALAVGILEGAGVRAVTFWKTSTG